MADNKKYYYMRLKENFFDTDDLKMLEAMPDGYLYSNILIKLYLKSLKYEGRLLFKDTIPYNSQMIATITGHHIGVVEKSLQTFRDLGLITILDGNVMYMNEIEMLVGKTSTEADRKREVRKKIDSGEFKALPISESGQMSGQMSDEIPTNIHQSIELEKELKKELKKDKTVRQDELEFEEFWKVYPRKYARPAAKTKFNSALKKYDFETIMKGTYKYAELCRIKNTSMEYIAHASTFLNQERYLDDYDVLIKDYQNNRNGGYRNEWNARPNEKPSFKETFGTDVGF